MKSWLEKNAIKMCSVYNEGKSVAAERLIRTLKNEIYKDMTLISKNVYIDKLDYIVNKHNNTYHRTIKMKSVEVKRSIHFELKKENNKKDFKFKVGDMLEYQNIKLSLQKALFQIGLKKIL